MKNGSKFKIWKTIGGALASIVLVLIIIITSVMLFTRDKYQVPNVFGYSFLNIATNSMEGDKNDSLFVGDLIIINRNVDKMNLEVDDIITFETLIQGQVVLNTHRIIEVFENNEGVAISYQTKGDNPAASTDEILVIPSKIVGVYDGKIGGLGGFVTFLQSTTGFFLLIVLPAILFLGYELVQFIRTLLDYKLEKEGLANKETEEQMKQRLKAELLEEMKQQK